MSFWRTSVNNVNVRHRSQSGPIQTWKIWGFAGCSFRCWGPLDNSHRFLWRYIFTKSSPPISQSLPGQVTVGLRSPIFEIFPHNKIKIGVYESWHFVEKMKQYYRSKHDFRYAVIVNPKQYYKNRTRNNMNSKLVGKVCAIASQSSVLLMPIHRMKMVQYIQPRTLNTCMNAPKRKTDFSQFDRNKTTSIICPKLKLSDCPKIQMPGCNPARRPPKCIKFTVPKDCIPLKAPIASYHECKKSPIDKPDPKECRCWARHYSNNKIKRISL